MGPRAAALIASGTAWFEGTELVGCAADGRIVAFTIIWSHTDVQTAEGYLESHPTPDTW
jgi:hypothetical protein